LKKEQGFVSKNLGTESKNKVESSYALNSFLQMIADTEPERATNGKNQAKQWSKALKSNSCAAPQCSSQDDDTEPPAKKHQVESDHSDSEPPAKRRRVESDHSDTADPFKLSVEEIQHKIALEKQVEEGAVYRRTILEYMLELKVKQPDSDLQ